MLKLKPNPTFWHTVRITVPESDKPLPVDFEFKHKTKEQLEEFVSRFKDGRSDNVILEEVINGWKGIDEDYSASALRDLCSNYPPSGLEILNGYLAALTESRAKNFSR